MPQVTRLRTVFTPDEAQRIVSRAFLDVTGYAPGSRILALLLALSDLETAGWEKMFNNNWGNIIATDPERQDFWEGDDTGNLRKFRSWLTGKEGAVAFVRQLLRDSRAAWRAGLLTGDPRKFVDALAGKVDGKRYFEANPQTYLATFLERHAPYATALRVGVGGAFADRSPRVRGPMVGAALAPDESLPLYPAEVNTWAVAVFRQGGDGSKVDGDAIVQQTVDTMWPDVQALIPGPSSPAKVVPWGTLERDGVALSVLEFTKWLPPPGSEYVLILLQFDYLGTDRVMPWFPEPLRVAQVWKVDEHVPDERVHSFLRTLWEASKLAAEDAQEFIGDTGRQLAGGLGMGLGLAAGAAVAIWLFLRQSKKGRSVR